MYLISIRRLNWLRSLKTRCSGCEKGIKIYFMWQTSKNLPRDAVYSLRFCIGHRTKLSENRALYSQYRPIWHKFEIIFTLEATLLAQLTRPPYWSAVATPHILYFIGVDTLCDRNFHSVKFLLRITTATTKPSGDDQITQKQLTLSKQVSDKIVII